MRRSETKSKSQIYLALLTVLALILPNVLLDFTEITIPVWGKILNVFFPLSFYCFLTTAFKRTGWGVLCCFPFMLYAAFQLVLLYLYGESLIAVDMFLNVVTTDFEEASTLLQNLTPAIVLVIILYLPPLVWAIVSIRKKKIMPQYVRLVALSWSACGLVVFGILMIILAVFGASRPNRDVFPVNVINNMTTAVTRARLSALYPESAKDFTYNAVDADETPRVVALVIGETSRPDRWQIFGAERETNPKLSKRENLYIFDKAVTQSNTTHKSVPLLLTPLTAETFGELNDYKSLITAFKEAGFQTAWISNQPPNGAYNEHMGYEADTSMVFKYVPDVELVHHAEEYLKKADKNKSQLIVLHTYGGHFPYDDRYKGMKPTFTPDRPMIANSANRTRLVNAYDNATKATDLAVDSMISVINRFNDDAVLVYAADHGEDLFDDYREKFLHASPAPTFYQLRVPMFVWVSPVYEQRKSVSEKLAAQSHIPLSPAVSLFHTMMDLGGVGTEYYNPRYSIVSDRFAPYPMMYLTDRNEAVPLVESGIREIDVQKLDSLNILQYSKPHVD